jgi:hypothetical protein
MSGTLKETKKIVGSGTAADPYIIVSVKNSIRKPKNKTKSYEQKAKKIFKWLLGENGFFPQYYAGAGHYYWRTELRKRLKKAGIIAR